MISVVIPVLNESKTVAEVVKYAQTQPGVSEVIVIDDGSIDETPTIAKKAGAKVFTSTLMGKGVSMEEGAKIASQEYLVYLDGDLSNLPSDLVAHITAPLLADEADFVKARFSRAAGRVTTLTAKPLIQTFFPELAHIAQPLGGIIAARRSLLRRLRFESDYGVDVGLLIDASNIQARIVEIDIGHITHDSQSLQALGDMAKQVLRTILDRASRYGRLHPLQVDEVQEVERSAQAEFDVLLPKLNHAEKLALFDMDGTLLDGRFVVSLADHTGVRQELDKLLDHSELTPEARTRAIAGQFKGVSRQQMMDVARGMPLVPGAVEAVVGLRKAGYRVCIVTDSFYTAADTIRRRVFADITIAHVMRYRAGLATGELTLCPAMIHSNGCTRHPVCKFNVLLHMTERMGLSSHDVVAVGDSVNDVCMLQAAGLGVAYRPKTPEVEKAAQHRIDGKLSEILPLVGAKKPRVATPIKPEPVGKS